MGGEVFRRARGAVAAQIVGARHVDEVELSERPGDHAGIRQGADAQRAVDAVPDQVDRAVRDAEGDVDAGEARQEVRQGRSDDQPPDPSRHVDAELP